MNPKPVCSRPDCGKPMRQWGYCERHSILWRRNGVPYRQDEIAEMREGNQHQAAMDAALAADPPVISWTKNSRGVLIGTVVHDPHVDKKDAPHRRDAQARGYEKKRLETFCTTPQDSSLLAAARTDI